MTLFDKESAARARLGELIANVDPAREYDDACSGLPFTGAELREQMQKTVRLNGVDLRSVQSCFPTITTESTHPIEALCLTCGRRHGTPMCPPPRKRRHSPGAA
jgi:hypothetical protein